MSKQTIKDIINSLRADFEEKQKQAQAEFEKKMADTLETVIKNTREWLEKAHSNFEFLDKDSQAAVLNDAEIKKLFASFGYVKRKTADGSAGRGGRYDEAAILAFLADGEKEQAAIQAHFGVSKQSVVAWGKKLFEAGKIHTIEKRGRQKFWKAKA